MGRLIRRSFGILLLLLVVGAGAEALWLRSSLPLTDGTLAVSGLDHEVRIVRDRYGIPTIRAQSEHDAAFALGFLHAQDRLFAMDMMRHYGAGRLSEIFGTRTLGIDETMRTLGLYRSAEAEYAGLAPPVRATLDAYAAGVNAFLATRRGALPPEYYLLGAAPESWRVADSLVWGKIMDLELTANFRRQLQRARLLARLPAADLAVLFPSYPKDAPITLPERAALERLPLDRLIAVLPRGIGPQAASNNWVVDGLHSDSGKPLLANDPHLDFSAPGVWYLARIVTPDLDLTGATAPGNPFVIVGHNQNIAWGFSTTGGDVEDLFIEQADPADPARYQTPDGPRPYATRVERILVRSASPVNWTVRETRHGPVISDLANYAVGNETLALQTTWLGSDDTTPQAMWKLDRAKDWTGFRDAMQDWVAPQQNIVYADTEANIGFMAPARLPIRKSGDGLIPEPGWSGEFDWTGMVPFDGLPSAFNPPAGRIVSANNKIVPDDYPYFITHDWELPYRAERINTLLDRTPRQSPDTSAAIQSDDLSLPTQILLPLMLKAKPQDNETEPLIALLRRWDGRMNANRPEPLLFTAWVRELTRELLEPRLGPLFRSFWSPRPDVLALILTQHHEWCGANGDCDAVLAQSFDRAVAELRRTYGQSPVWRWGAAHRAAFRSEIWSSVPLAARWFDLEVGVDGDNDTVNAGDMYFGEEPDPYLDLHGPSLRMIVDLAAPAEARFSVAPGQSGNPLSPHWGDLVERWRAVQYLTFGADASGGVLLLEPQ